MIVHSLIVIVLQLSQEKHVYVNGTIESNNAEERNQFKHQNHKDDLRNEANFNNSAHLPYILFVRDVLLYVQQVLRWKINYYVHTDLPTFLSGITRTLDVL
ncbi:hypothetical protein WN55_10071 [Dufourea novaeangliae]|uniref:Secreted protein n=1 Tax=Dufourea novaeangliae TaxID=178035 RepID=A0A154PAI0_DUFNO|nr:hypothetical protein WN55_10071 [Dufourea novaeangliae]